MINERQNVIIENGSENCKIGLSSESEPQSFPSIIGRLRPIGICVETIGYYVGNDAEEKKKHLKLKLSN